MNDRKANLELHLQNRPDVTWDLRERDRASALRNVESIDRYVESLGFSKIGASWIALNHVEATATLEAVLHKNLAYTSCEVMTLDAAKKLASEFIDCFSTEAKFFTNGRWYESNANWMPVTNSTFDGGVVALDEKFIGIIWVEAED